MKIAVYIKTHLWDNDIKEFVYKISNDCSINNNVKFFLLAQSDIEKKIPEDIMKFTKIYTPRNIEKFYKKGFLSLWLSNHIITQWFYFNYGKEYDYIWSIEYDVRILGDSNYIWNFNNNADLITPCELIKTNSYYTWDKTLNSFFTTNERYKALLQLHRVSKNFIMKLHELFNKGINGQDELIYGSVCKKYNFNYNTSFLQNIIGGIWHTSPMFSNHNKKIYNNMKKLNNISIKIFHPIKSQDNINFNFDNVNILDKNLVKINKVIRNINFNENNEIDIVDINENKIKIFDDTKIQKVLVKKNNIKKPKKKINVSTSINKIRSNNKIKKITTKNKK